MGTEGPMVQNLRIITHVTGLLKRRKNVRLKKDLNNNLKCPNLARAYTTWFKKLNKHQTGETLKVLCQDTSSTSDHNENHLESMWQKGCFTDREVTGERQFSYETMVHRRWNVEKQMFSFVLKELWIAHRMSHENIFQEWRGKDINEEEKNIH